MTLNFQGADGQTAELLAATEGMYRDAGVELARAVKAAFQLAMEEGNKIEKLRRETTAAIGGDILDLDAARDEIGRRLACLRRAGGGN